VKVFLHTMRYGADLTLTYHGKDIELDYAEGMFVVREPVLDGLPEAMRAEGAGLLTAVSFVSTDEMTIVACKPECEHHPDDAKKVVNIL